MPPTRPRSAVHRLAATVVLSLLAVSLGSAPASAAPVTTSPRSSWAPWMACPDGSAGNCAEVRAITRTADGTVFLGGLFTELRNPEGTRSVTVQNLAALAPDGTPASHVRAHTFAGPSANGSVLALATDGTTVYAGGRFTTVDGETVRRVARFSAATGERLPFADGVFGTVHAVEHDPVRKKLYLGGSFTTVQGASRTNLASLDAATGALDPSWQPAATLIPDDASPNDPAHNQVAVRSIALAPDGRRVYVAGDMDRLNGAARPAIAAVDPVTGATDTTFAPPTTVNTSFQGFQIAVVDSSGARTPGVLLAAGGLTNRSFRFNLDGSLAWTITTNGDAQAVAVIDDIVYLGGHFTRAYTDDLTIAAERMHIAAYPYVSAGNPLPLPRWSPSLSPAFPPYFYGVWTLEAYGSQLHAGGVFNLVDSGGKTHRQPKYVRFDGFAEPPARLPYNHAFNADSFPDVLATRTDGALILYPGNGRGGFLDGYPQIGDGWQHRDMIRHAQDWDRDGARDLLARDPRDGALWFYRGNGRGGFHVRQVIGAGWGGFSQILAPGDWNSDGNPDLLTVRPNGSMNLYPGNGYGGFGSSYPQIGAGWQTRDMLTPVGDWDGDGHADLVAREPANGNLWLYSGNGSGGFRSQRVIGSGWGIFTALLGPGDWDGNGTMDILARRANGDLYLYPGNGRGDFGGAYPKIGAGWSSLRIVGSGVPASGPGSQL